MSEIESEESDIDGPDFQKPSSTSDSSDDESEFYFLPRHLQRDQDEQPQHERNVVQDVRCEPPEAGTADGRRYPKRKGAGKHSNPHNLPKSVLQKTCTVGEKPSFDDLAKAISMLGETIGQSLGGILKESYSGQK